MTAKEIFALSGLVFGPVKNLERSELIIVSLY